MNHKVNKMLKPFIKKGLKLISLSLGTLTICLFIFYLATIFFGKYKFTWQWPIIFQKFLLIEENKTLSPLVDPVEAIDFKKPIIINKVDYLDLDEIVDKIWILESSKGEAGEGLHIYCRKKGQWNEYGYGGMKMKLCFDNKKEADKEVYYWLQNNLKRFDGNLGMTICYYNLGLKQNSCPYYENFKKLK